MSKKLILMTTALVCSTMQDENRNLLKFNSVCGHKS